MDLVFKLEGDNVIFQPILYNNTAGADLAQREYLGGECLKKPCTEIAFRNIRFKYGKKSKYLIVYNDIRETWVSDTPSKLQMAA